MNSQINIKKEQVGLMVIYHTLNSLYQTFYGKIPLKIDTSIAELLSILQEEIRSKNE